VVPAAALVRAVPALSQAERAALRDSVFRQGQLEPVVVSAGPAFPGEVADGLARLQVCAELGLECARVERPFASELEFACYRLSVNLRRRQLTDAARIRLAQLLEPHERQLAAGRRAQASGRRRGEKALPVSRPEERGETRERLAVVAALSPATYSRGAKVLREGSPRLVAGYDAGKFTTNGAYGRLRAEQQRATNAALAERLANAPPPLPLGRYSVLAIDPPWPLECALPYPTMPLEQIAALPVSDLLAEDAVVWLWTTNSFLQKAFGVVEGWGVEYRTKLEWAKDRVGTGTLLRGQTEPCLVFTRGRPRVTLTTQSTLLVAPVREHSRKPDEFYALVESLCPGSKLELFAREPRPGWDAWGAEPNKFTTDGIDR
jgi:N6-adenosine-specific RNA methylase IME4